MKVLNLLCGGGHAFEGWFSNEQDFQDQHTRGLLSCPVCGSPEVHKGLSAPRLNLSGTHDAPATQEDGRPATDPSANLSSALVRAWLEVSRHIVATTEDVGESFVHEARKMHYGEAESRSIRGRAATTDVLELMEEGIEVLPLVLPESSKQTLQ